MNAIHTLRQKAAQCRENAPRVLVVVLILSLALAPLSAPLVAAQETEGPTYGACTVGPPVPADDQDRDIEVALVNDRTFSMSEGTRMQDLKNGTTGFVDQLEEPDEVGMASFGSTSRQDIGLTQDYGAVNDEIDSLSPDSTTGNAFEAGIRDGTDILLNGSNSTTGTTKVLIFATDGDVGTQQEQDAIAAANDAKAEGIVVFSVGFGGETDEQFLQDIASGDDRVYISPDSSDLDSIYQDISQDVEEIETDIEIETKSMFRPGTTAPYTVYQNVTDGNTTETVDVTDEANVTSTDPSVLAVNGNGTLTAASDENTSTWVRLDAAHNSSQGCTNVIVTEPTVEALELIPNGLLRLWAIFADPTMFAIIVAALLSVPAARFSTSFAGLAVAELVIVIGWLAGYVGLGIAMTSIFIAMFIGLNLAENTEFASFQGR